MTYTATTTTASTASLWKLRPYPKIALSVCPRNSAKNWATCRPFVWCKKYAKSGIHLIDPFTAQLTSMAYFKSPFEALCDPNQLVEYIIMELEIILDKDRKHVPGQGQLSFKHALCDVRVVRASELGINDNPVNTGTHLGHLLKVSDIVMGYNLSEANLNNTEFEKLSNEEIADVVLVRKCYADRQTRTNRRNWKMKHMTEDHTYERSKYNFHQFLEDLEENEDIRQYINIYRDPKRLQVDDGDTLGITDNIPRITLAEMLEDLTLDAADDEMGEEVAEETLIYLNYNIHIFVCQTLLPLMPWMIQMIL